MTFDQIIQFRRSNRKFDPNQPIPADVVEKALEHATLAPNSSNMQLWEFHWVRDEEKKKKLIHACLNQSAAKTAQELVVIVTRRDKWRPNKDLPAGTIITNKDLEVLRPVYHLRS